MLKKRPYSEPQNLPQCAVDFIKLVIKKMRYRKNVRDEVMAELSAHFEDELRDYTTDEDKEQKARQLITEFGDVKLLAVLLRRAKKRCRPLWRTVVARTFQTVGVLILCFVVYLGWFLTGKPVITTDYVAELNRIVKPVADGSLNAAPLYDKAVELWVEEPEKPGNLLGLADWPANLSADQMASVKRWIKANKASFEQIKLGTEKPHYWRRYQSKSGEMLSVLVPSLGEYRRMARLIVLRAKIRAYQGRVEEALDDILMCYRLGMHQKVPTTLIEQLVGISIEAIAVDTARVVFDKIDVDREALADFQQNFQKLVEKNNFRMQLDGEELSTLDEIQRSFTGGLGGGHIIPRRIAELNQVITGLCAGGTGSVSSPIKQKQSWLSEFMSNLRHEICEAGGCIHEMGSFIKKSLYVLFVHPDKHQTFEAAQELHIYFGNLAIKTPSQIRTEKIDPEKEIMEIVKGNILLELLAPAVVRVNELTHQNKAESEALLTVLSLLRYKNDKGFYPENLQELITAGYLKKLLNDPYSNKPLVCKKIDDGFMLYSIGPNFKDDGGRIIYSSKGRPVWQGSKKGGDMVFWPIPESQVKQ